MHSTKSDPYPTLNPQPSPGLPSTPGRVQGSVEETSPGSSGTGVSRDGRVGGRSTGRVSSTSELRSRGQGVRLGFLPSGPSITPPEVLKGRETSTPVTRVSQWWDGPGCRRGSVSAGPRDGVGAPKGQCPVEGRRCPGWTWEGSVLTLSLGDGGHLCGLVGVLSLPHTREERRGGEVPRWVTRREGRRVPNTRGEGRTGCPCEEKGHTGDGRVNRSLCPHPLRITRSDRSFDSKIRGFLSESKLGPVLWTPV